MDQGVTIIGYPSADPFQQSDSFISAYAQRQRGDQLIVPPHRRYLQLAPRLCSEGAHPRCHPTELLKGVYTRESVKCAPGRLEAVEIGSALDDPHPEALMA